MYLCLAKGLPKNYLITIFTIIICDYRVAFTSRNLQLFSVHKISYWMILWPILKMLYGQNLLL